MQKSNFQQMMSGADVVQLRKSVQTLTDSKDLEKMEWLKELVSLSGDEGLSSTIQGQINGIRDSQMSDEQRNLQVVSERIEKGMKLFNYSIERSKTGVFVDARQDEV